MRITNPGRRVRLAATLAAAATTAILAPAAALGSTVSIERSDFDDDGTPDAATLSYLAQEGERNDVRVTQSGQTFTVTDPGAAITAPPESNCTVSGDGRTATCTNPGAPDLSRVRLSLEDGDDVAVNDTSVLGGLTGGQGNDRLTGSDATLPANESLEGNEFLEGGPGNDTLLGRGGPDFLTDGEGEGEGEGSTTPDGDDTYFGGPGGDLLSSGTGNDTVAGEDGDDFVDPGPGTDTVEGGPGVDTLAYFGRMAAVTVNLTTRGGQGEAGENDAQAGIEDVFGGEGGDTITGDTGSNELSGGPGNDTIAAGPGADFVFAGSGDDTVRIRDDGGDRAFCSTGTDTAEADDVDVLSECERATVTRAVPPTTRVEVPVPMPVPVPAPADRAAPVISSRAPARTLRRSRLARSFTQRVAVNEPATVRVQLLGRLGSRGRIARAGDVVLSESRAALVPNRPRGFRVRLTRAARRALPRRGRVRLTLLITAVDASGNEAIRRYRITVR